MILMLDLPAVLEAELTAESERLGVSVSEVVTQRLASVNRNPGESKKTGRDLVALWRQSGVIGSRSDITDSTEYARQLRREAETRIH